MPSCSTPLLRRLLAAGVASVSLAMASCAPLRPTVSVALPPIPAGEARFMTIRVKLHGSIGLLARYVELLVDDEGLDIVTFRLTGTITRIAGEAAVRNGGK